jgi:hypothetical protein
VTRLPVAAALACSLVSIACGGAATKRVGGARPPAASAAEPPRDSGACFPTEHLPADERRLAERLLLEFSDREGFYTLAGGLKPISSGVGDLQVRIAPTLDTAMLRQLDRLRVVAQALRCRDLGMFVQVFASTFPSRDSSTVRSATVVLYHTAAVRAAIIRHAAFFATLGVTQSTDPRDVIAAVENADQADRWRGYGLLFGYPDEAVDFFVWAGTEGARTKALVPRDFRRIETFTKFPERQGGPPVLSTFVYAVARGAEETAADRALREAAAPLMARYVRLREQFIRQDSTGAAALWRAWHARP